MTNKLFVPDHVAKAAQKAIKENTPMPKPIENAFGKGAEKTNEDDPSQMDASALGEARAPEHPVVHVHLRQASRQHHP